MAIIKTIEEARAFLFDLTEKSDIFEAWLCQYQPSDMFEAFNLSELQLEYLSIVDPEAYAASMEY